MPSSSGGSAPATVPPLQGSCGGTAERCFDDLRRLSARDPAATRGAVARGAWSAPSRPREGAPAFEVGTSQECLELFKIMKAPDESLPDMGVLSFEHVKTYE